MRRRQFSKEWRFHSRVGKDGEDLGTGMTCNRESGKGA